MFNELWYLYTRHHSSLIWTQIILDQILHFTWQKEQYANQHFTFCLPCREWGNEGIKILLWYLVKNHYKILFIWTIGIFEIVQSVEIQTMQRKNVYITNHLKFAATLRLILSIRVKQYFILISKEKVVTTFKINLYVSGDH